jgi:hypothetical protein
VVLQAQLIVCTVIKMISWRRFKEFLRVAFGPRVTWRDWLQILKASVSILRSPYSQEMWYARMRICYKCPIFDKERKTCRPHPKSKMGCGCYAPYKAMVKKDCWGKETYGVGFGW